MSNSADELMTLPTLSFSLELDRLLSASPHWPVDGDKTKRLADVELDEVREALVKAGLSVSAIDEAAKKYRREQPPAELPPEFALYAKGANAWREGNTEVALAAWKELLGLPQEQRHYRTVWAAYMVGRTLWDKDANAARASFSLAREAVSQGFADSQELAVASLGWEARTYYQGGDYAKAAKLYFRQYAQGGVSATVSLQMTLQRVFQTDTEKDATADVVSAGSIPEDKAPPPRDGILKELAADGELRGVVTAWFSARGGPMTPWSTREASTQFARWLKIVGATASLDGREADRWCWVAYQNGMWDEADKFAGQAPAHAPASEWVRSMLLLRKGKVEEAIEHLSNAAKYFPEDNAMAGISFVPPWRYNQSEQQPLLSPPVRHLGGVSGVLALSREQYIEALRLFLQAKQWSDAAYVAEYVLSEDELLKFVREECSAVPQAYSRDEWWEPLDMRYLLARRLVRVGRFDEAREFFPEGQIVAFDSYVRDVRTGYDLQQPTRKRAEAFWAAAKVMRTFGMELQGTSLHPDYAMWGGQHEYPQTWRWRAYAGIGPGGASWNPGGAQWRAGVLFGPPADELRRAVEAKVPKNRFHYRHRAAELAWLAAALLPNDDDMTALILNTAGRWIAVRDPQQANLFYKTLTIRCPNTVLGKEAAIRTWLVPADAAPSSSE
ncbi:MAG: hypothetical protein IPP19_11035 [Verrucomicrobia bacterium]|nr:hypothetical protein [Verrucomicrobiota bacterium]